MYPFCKGLYDLCLKRNGYTNRAVIPTGSKRENMWIWFALPNRACINLIYAITADVASDNCDVDYGALAYIVRYRRMDSGYATNAGNYFKRDDYPVVESSYNPE